MITLPNVEEYIFFFIPNNPNATVDPRSSLALPLFLVLISCLAKECQVTSLISYRCSLITYFY